MRIVRILYSIPTLVPDYEKPLHLPTSQLLRENARTILCRPRLDKCKFRVIFEQFVVSCVRGNAGQFCAVLISSMRCSRVGTLMREGSCISFFFPFRSQFLVTQIL